MYPVAGSQYQNSDYHHIDLSINNADLQNLGTQDALSLYIQKQTQLAGKRLAYGGYREQRNLYQRSELFSAEARTLHLGIDVWLGAGEPVYAHAAGTIHSIKNNDAHLDYGYTVITKHNNIDGSAYFSLYGHLSSSGLADMKVGQNLKEAQRLAYIGDINENGGWAPHLHFQLMLDMEGYSGDYPGVCSQEKADHYFTNCPDPIKHILI